MTECWTHVSFVACFVSFHGHDHAAQSAQKTLRTGPDLFDIYSVLVRWAQEKISLISQLSLAAHFSMELLGQWCARNLFCCGVEVPVLRYCADFFSDAVIILLLSHEY